MLGLDRSASVEAHAGSRKSGLGVAAGLISQHFEPNTQVRDAKSDNAFPVEEGSLDSVLSNPVRNGHDTPAPSSPNCVTANKQRATTYDSYTSTVGQYQGVIITNLR
mgnify:CR=1 FL=1